MIFKYVIFLSYKFKGVNWKIPDRIPKTFIFIFDLIEFYLISLIIKILIKKLSNINQSSRFQVILIFSNTFNSTLKRTFITQVFISAASKSFIMIPLFRLFKINSSRSR